MLRCPGSNDVIPDVATVIIGELTVELVANYESSEVVGPPLGSARPAPK
jgi:hypothetical protein